MLPHVTTCYHNGIEKSRPKNTFLLQALLRCSADWASWKKVHLTAAQLVTAQNCGSNFAPNRQCWNIFDNVLYHVASFFFGAIILTHTAYPFAQGSWKGDRSWKDVCEVLRVCDVKIDSNGWQEAHAQMLWLVELYCSFFFFNNL